MLKGEAIAFYAQWIIVNCWKFVIENWNFGKAFIFKWKDYAASIKKGTSELWKLLEVYELYIPNENLELKIPEPELSLYKDIFP